MKPVHVKPSFYSYCFEALKEIAYKYGYNLVLHGSMNRDLDLIAIPWQEKLGNIDTMISEFCKYTGGSLMLQDGDKFRTTYHKRRWYVIEMNREGYLDKNNVWTDPQYYFDISVLPPYETTFTIKGEDLAYVVNKYKRQTQ